MRSGKNLKLVQLALMIALVIILQLFFSSLTVGPVTLSFVLVPIVISSIFISPVAGLIVGFVSGVTTLIQVLTSGSPFYVFLVSVNIPATALICLLKTSAAGLLSGIVYRAFSKANKKTFGTIAASVVCPIVNTGLFCLGMLVFFADALCTDATFGSAAAGNVIYFIFIGLAGINFVVELVLNCIICPVISKALFSSKYFKNVQ